MASFDGTIKINTKIDQSGVKSGLSEMQSSCQSFASTVGAIFAGIGVFEFGKSALKSTADIELAQVKLETLLGSADHAQAMIADIIKMADTTPYNSNDLIEAATTLKTFGVSASEIMPTLTALGNAAGGQADKLKGVAMALGQTAAQGKMMTQDLYQFINAGVPLLDLLAKRLNKSKGEIKGMIEAGKIGYAEVNGALQEFYTGNGKYANLMAKAAQTLPGLWSSFQDSVMSLGRALVSIFEGQIKGALQTAIKFFQTLANAVNNLSTPAKNVIASFGSTAAIFIALAVAVGIATTAFSTLFTVLRANPFGFIIALIGTMIIKLIDLNGAAADSMGLEPEEIEKALKIYEKIAKVQRDALREAERSGDSLSARGVVQETVTSLEGMLDTMSRLTPSSEGWTQEVTRAAAAVKLLESSTSLQFVTDEDRQRVKQLADQFRMMYAEKKKAAIKSEMPVTDPNSGGAAAEAAAIANRKKMWEDYYAWKIGEVEGSLSEEIAIINRKADEENTAAAGDALLQAAIEEKRGADVLAAREKWGEKHKIAAFLMGQGYSESEASGIESGVHFVTHAVKETFEAIAQTAAVMGAIFSGAINLADWMVSFDPKEIMPEFKKYMESLADFFENDLGSIPVFFDQGVAIFEKFLAGMVANLPAIVQTLGNVIDKIVGYISANAGTIIDQVLTIVVALAQVIISKLPAIFAAAFQAVISLLGKIADLAPDLIKTLFDAVGQMISYIGAHAGELISALIDALVAVFIGVAKNFDKIVEPLAEATPEIALAMTLTLPIELIKASPAIIQALVVGILKSLPALVRGLATGMYNAGKQIIQGIIKGILAIGDFWSSVKRIFTGFVDAVLGFFGIHSPSTVFADIGVNIVLGLVNGILSIGSTVWDAIKSILTFDFTETFTALFNVGQDIIRSLASGVTSMWDALVSLFSFDVDGLSDSIKSIGGTIVDAIKSGITAPINLFIDAINAVIRALNKIHVKLPKWLGGHSFGISIEPIQKLAKGTDNAVGGMTLVGEEGPELVSMPAHSSVLTASKTMRLLSALNNFSGVGLAGATGGGSFSFDISAADVKIDGDMVGQVVFKRIDKIVRNAYGVRQ